MSTAGKVLTVLSALLLVVWTIMISAVAKINENGSVALDTRKKAVADLEAGILKADSANVEFRETAAQEQVQKDREIRVVREKLTIVEGQMTSAQEALSRAQLQLQNYTTAAAASKADLDARQGEKTDLEKVLADTQALVKKLQGENDELLAQLEKLRSDFQETLRKNVAEVRKDSKPASKASKTAE